MEFDISLFFLFFLVGLNMLWFSVFNYVIFIIFLGGIMIVVIMYFLDFGGGLMLEVILVY